MNNLFTYLKAIAVPVLVGAAVGLLISGFMNYGDFLKPPLSPPAVLFPIVWTILYTLMGISYGRLQVKGLTNDNITLIYYLQLFLNTLWPIFFFIFDWYLFSFFWLLLLIALVILMIIQFYQKDKIAGILQIPYLLWLCFAAYLNFGVYLLN